LEALFNKTAERKNSPRTSGGKTKAVEKKSGKFEEIRRIEKAAPSTSMCGRREGPQLEKGDRGLGILLRSDERKKKRTSKRERGEGSGVAGSEK